MMAALGQQKTWRSRALGQPEAFLLNQKSSRAPASHQ